MNSNESKHLSTHGSVNNYGSVQLRPKIVEQPFEGELKPKIDTKKPTNGTYRDDTLSHQSEEFLRVVGDKKQGYQKYEEMRNSISQDGKVDMTEANRRISQILVDHYIVSFSF